MADRFRLSWSHYVLLVRANSPYAREFYEAEALRGGWTVRQLRRQIPAMHQDIAVIWDEDHDVRVISVVQALYEEQLLHPVLFIGERKGMLAVIVTPEHKAKLDTYLPEVVRHADAVRADPWAADVSVHVKSGNRTSIISAATEDIDIFLLSIQRLWSLGVKPRSQGESAPLTAKTVE